VDAAPTVATAAAAAVGSGKAATIRQSKLDRESYEENFKPHPE